MFMFSSSIGRPLRGAAGAVGRGEEGRDNIVAHVAAVDVVDATLYGRKRGAHDVGPMWAGVSSRRTFARSVGVRRIDLQVSAKGRLKTHVRQVERTINDRVENSYCRVDRRGAGADQPRSGWTTDTTAIPDRICFTEHGCIMIGEHHHRRRTSTSASPRTRTGKDSWSQKLGCTDTSIEYGCN